MIAAAFSIISALSGGCASIHYDVTAVGRLFCDRGCIDYKVTAVGLLSCVIAGFLKLIFTFKLLEYTNQD